jgi:hypothetical protein
MKQNRAYLIGEFADGQRPSGQDFADFIESFVHQDEDGFSIDTNNNLSLSNGVTIGDSTEDTPGTIRFSSGVFQFRNNTEWQDLGTGAGGAFVPLGTPGTVGYEGGNVGIQTGPSGADYRLDVRINPTGVFSDLSQRIRLGPGVITRGISGSTVNPSDDEFFFLMHEEVFTQGNPETEFALGTDPDGNVILNAGGNGLLFLTNNRNLSEGMMIGPQGVSIASFMIPTSFPNDGSVPGTGNNTDTSQPIRFYVNGNAAKGTPGAGFLNTSDARTKEDIVEFEDGLEKLQQIKPVRFRYNGKAHTVKDIGGIGIIAQELQKVFPEMIHKCKGELDEKGKEEEILLTDTSSLIYVAVNAIKELNQKVERLQTKLNGLQTATG